ncbi:MAG: hypothetical protein J6Y85_04080, partial [Alphaproteobacteria bacterium]|nr:hypothetical protein [Alphaproteobacteria bacterium]
MKKNIFVLALSFTLATVAHAETTIEWTEAGCQSVGGTWITAHNASDSGCDAAHCNGRNFCRSPNPMNWFSALIWCKSIGRTLADFNHVCPGTPFVDKQICANMKGLSSSAIKVTTSMPMDNNRGHYIYLPDGKITFGS